MVRGYNSEQWDGVTFDKLLTDLYGIQDATSWHVRIFAWGEHERRRIYIKSLTNILGDFKQMICHEL